MAQENVMPNKHSCFLAKAALLHYVSQFRIGVKNRKQYMP